MANQIYPLRIDPGDIITFEFHGRLFTGEVISASNYGEQDDPDWYIEWKNEVNDRYGYWKQKLDGGNGKLVSHYRQSDDPRSF